MIPAILTNVIYWINGEPRYRTFSNEECALLIQYLNHRKSRVRWMAANILGRQKAHESVDVLVQTLKDPHWLVRLHAAKALGRIGDPRALNNLITALRDEHASVRRYAIDALGGFHDEQAMAALLRILKDDRTLWHHVYSSLAKSMEAHVALDLMNATITPGACHHRSLIFQIGHHATPLLLSLLLWRVEWWQLAIINVLRQIGDTRTLSILRNFRSDSRPRIREAAYQAPILIEYRQYLHLIPK